MIDDPLGESTLLVDMKVSNHACCSGVNSVAEVEGLRGSCTVLPSRHVNMSAGQDSTAEHV